MKLCHTAFLILVSFSLLSGCAYVQGRKADQQQAAAMKKATSSSAQVITPQGPPQPQPRTAPNPSTTASKMIAPLTQ